MLRWTRISKYLILALSYLAMVISSCKEDEQPVPALETGSLTDIDGNIYKTVKIGNQWWMAENLKVSRYSDGSVLPFVQDPVVGWATSSDAYCIYSNAQSVTGFLYNWNAVSNPAKLAPIGWHIPTDEEWKQLELQLGMSDGQANGTGWRGSVEGEKLKMEGNSGWVFYENVWNTNESGFAAEAGSCMLFNGKSGDPGLQYNGFWWSASEHSSTDSWYRHMDYKERRVFRFYGQKKYGFSVRCIKD